MKKQIKNLVSAALVMSLTGCNFLNKTEVRKDTPVEPVKREAPIDESGYTTYEAQAEDMAMSDEVEPSAPVPQSMPSERHAASGMYNVGVAGGSYHSKKAGIGGIMPYPGVIMPNTESYDTINENGFRQCSNDPLSTFSIDVDTASYSNVRRFVTQGSTPPADAVRVEELINYFDYNYSQPENSSPFAVHLEMSQALWNKNHKLVRIGIKGREMKVDKRPASNLVFLIDVSGSMSDANKLPLLKSAFSMLVDKLNENDKVSIVVYAGAAGLVLKPTRGDKKAEILRALDQMQAGGSTNGGDGIELAYKTAQEQFIKGGVNRVILATDGDFNVGTTGRDGLLGLVEKGAKKNIYLSILGFGMGNYKDGTMEHLSNKGNGNYAYIDSQLEARKVMVEQLSGTLVTIAKDVKLQVEFNPKFVQSYRLVGYENRVLANEDFNNDKKDAGDIGAGHSVTALYEIVPVGVKQDEPGKVDGLKYQKVEAKTAPVAKETIVAQNDSNEWLTVKVRYKKPDGDVSAKEEFPFVPQEKTFNEASESFRFASAVALYGQLLRSSEHIKEGDMKKVISVAQSAKSNDKNGYKSEFVEIVKKTGKPAENSVADIGE
jgi:Ca-activated chloride channel homolog